MRDSYRFAQVSIEGRLSVRDATRSLCEYACGPGIEPTAVTVERYEPVSDRIVHAFEATLSAPPEADAAALTALLAPGASAAPVRAFIATGFHPDGAPATWVCRGRKSAVDWPLRMGDMLTSPANSFECRSARKVGGKWRLMEN